MAKSKRKISAPCSIGYNFLEGRAVIQDKDFKRRERER
jgi:hypothetical protein